jgi:peptidoglycan/xylan/chitin deacetylase (PgdA/CDA1 family)
MSWKKTALRLCGKVMPDLYRPLAGVLFPYAHIVADRAPVHVRHLYRIPSIVKFKSDVDFLSRRFKALPLSELQQFPHSDHKNGSNRSFVLSFDDGMREIYDVIAPILREKGIPAIFFLNSATIDNRQLMWRHKVSLLVERSGQQSGRVPPQLKLQPGEAVGSKLKALRAGEAHLLNDIARFFEVDFDDYLRRARPYLTADQVLELARAGFEFGAHSVSHPYFNELTAAEQQEQILGSVNFIRGLGLRCRCFAFPFHDNGVPASLFRYMSALDLDFSFGTSEARVDTIGFSFQRFALDADNADSSVGDLLKQLSAKSLWLRVSGAEIISRN